MDHYDFRVLGELTIQARSGRLLHPYAPEKDPVSLPDIAWSLAHQCRFGGNSLAFYSVAQHSVRVTELYGRRHLGVTDNNQLLGLLLHDAEESVWPDLPRGLKHSAPLKPYRIGGGFYQEHIYQRILGDGLEYLDRDLIHQADRLAGIDEYLELMSPPLAGSCPLAPVLFPFSIAGVHYTDEEVLLSDRYYSTPLSPQLAYHQFLECARSLGLNDLY